MKKSIGVVVVTLQAEPHLPKCLPPLIASPLKPRVLVVDSSSTDCTVALAKEMGTETLLIGRNEFNHGGTREMARRYLNTDIVVMVTQDAYAKDSSLLDHLVAPLLEGEASLAYARQLPHQGADFFEAFPRGFNYPEKSHIRSLDDLEHYGKYLYFCSNSCAAYLNSALDEVGGFPSVLLGEDTVVTAKLLQNGHKIAYVAEALIHHSHSYSLWQEFTRYFDTGIARQSYGHLLISPKSDTHRGACFVKEMSKTLWKEKPHLLPYAFLQSAVKWLGYQIGARSSQAPRWWKKRFSSQPYYW